MILPQRRRGCSSKLKERGLHVVSFSTDQTPPGFDVVVSEETGMYYWIKPDWEDTFELIGPYMKPSIARLACLVYVNGREE